MSAPTPHTSVTALKGIGPKLATALAEVGILSVLDLACWLPQRFEDRREVLTPSALPALLDAGEGRNLGVRGRVHKRRLVGPRGRFGAALELTDSEGGLLACRWLHRFPAVMSAAYDEGEEIVVFGALGEYKGRPSMLHPRIAAGHKADSLVGGIVPIYPAIAGVGEARLARFVGEAFAAICEAEKVDPLSPELRDRHRLPELREALSALHRPDGDDASAAARAHRRFAFEELLFLQLALAQRRHAVGGRPAPAVQGAAQSAEACLSHLPFTLTGAQARAIAHIAEDLEGGSPMQRLLQGDVGSGKTVVALAAAAMVASSGWQAAVLAPTEILAEQHAARMAPVAEALGLDLRLLTGRLKAAPRRRVQDAMADGRAQIVIGTHALLSGDSLFRRLGLVVIDEQQRFGVAQRGALLRRGPGALIPHCLVMTATPIPRSLALAVYGDLEISLLDEKPPGRRPVRTEAFAQTQRKQAYDQLLGCIDAGGRAYVLLPTVGDLDDPDASDRPSVEHTTPELLEGWLKGRRVVTLHGRMDGTARREAMEALRSGDADILVATTVIEVGVDVPEATCILIEEADRFGLSQLHQLRGRVGRGEAPGRCLLVGSGAQTEAASRRLAVLCESDDGFRIAEEDLAIRGPGELLGTRQAGLPRFRHADPARDVELLAAAQRAARELIAADASLQAPEHAALRQSLAQRVSGAGGIEALGA